MREKMFNRDQVAHMEYLASIPADKKCWCGWYLLGECPHCSSDKTNADRIKNQCPDCKGDLPSHTIYCKAIKE